MEFLQLIFCNLLLLSLLVWGVARRRVTNLTRPPKTPVLPKESFCICSSYGPNKHSSPLPNNTLYYKSIRKPWLYCWWGCTQAASSSTTTTTKQAQSFCIFTQHSIYIMYNYSLYYILICIPRTYLTFSEIHDTCNFNTIKYWISVKQSDGNLHHSNH